MMRSLKIWGGLILALVGISYGAVWLTKDVKLPSEVVSALSVPVSETDHVQGPADAPITLVEYSDFQCPACGAFFPLLEQLKKDTKLAGKIRFVYRHFPLSTIHQHAQRAAQFAEAAGLQGKFWEFHDELFKGQASWEALSRAKADEVFFGYAQQLGLNMDRLKIDVDSSGVASAVAKSFSGGVASGVNSTPTFFVNGARMPHPTGYDQFKSFLLNAIPSVTQTP
jgi:protein-disulfide isomerase